MAPKKAAGKESAAPLPPVAEQLGEPAPEPAPAAADNGIVPTKPDRCRVVGDGLHKVAVKQYGCFTIEAFDDNGTRKDTGGDAFFIAIRGASRVRAKVTDMRDGTYIVEWKPTVSGSYTIAVSLFGNSLPGSPYKLEVDAPFPYAPNCEARGEALEHATARVPQTFEIRFRDRLGNVAQAVDLDVFVQPYHQPGATIEDVGPTAGGSSSPLRLNVKEAQSHNPESAIEDLPMPTKGTPMPSAPGLEDAATGSAPVDGDDDAFGVMTKRQRTINIQVGKKPLIVREYFDRDSQVIGQLWAGQLATVIEERIDNRTGDVRAW